VLELAGVAHKEKLVAVDVKAKLIEAGLYTIIPIGMWPDTNATRELATWVKNARKHFGPKAFVYADLKRSVFVKFLLTRRTRVYDQVLARSLPRCNTKWRKREQRYEK